MITIHKYPVPITDEVAIEMPYGADILDVQVQRNELQLWAVVNTDRHYETRRFRVIGTGHAITNFAYLKYIKTAQVFGGELVLHVFEVMP